MVSPEAPEALEISGGPEGRSRVLEWRRGGAMGAWIFSAVQADAAINLEP